MPTRTTPAVRRVRDTAEVEDLCEPHQPVALLVSSPLAEIGAAPQARSWAVGQPSHELGLLTAVRIRPGLVSASVLLLDPQGAPTLAALVRRSGATTLLGGAAHVDPVAALIPPARTTPLEMLARRVPERPEGEWRDRTRVARRDDVPALVDLYRRFELEILASDRLEETMRALVAQRRVVVALEGDEVVGAERIEARSRHWDLWAGLTVPPEHRRKGHSLALDLRARDLSYASGRGTAGVRAPTNHVPHRAADTIVHPWREVRVAGAASVPRRAVRRARREARRAGLVR